MNVRRFLKAVKRCLGVEESTPGMLRDPIEKGAVRALDESSSRRRRQAVIRHILVGGRAIIYEVVK